MKKTLFISAWAFILLIATIASIPVPVYSQGGGGISISVARKFVIYTTLPATCAAGQVAYQISDTSFYGCTSTNTWHLLGTSGGSGTVTSIVFSAPLTGGTVTTTGTVGCATCGVVVATGNSTMATAAVAGNTCATTVTTTATGAASTSRIIWTANADISSVTGYGFLSTDGLKVYAWPSSNAVNFHVCNGTAVSITPGAITFNWMVY